MVLILDANLSWRLTKILKSYYSDVTHVDDLPLNQPAKDSDIWEYAKTNNGVLVTNDNDFYKFSLLKGFPPNVVLLRTGNQSNNYIKDLLIKHKTAIIELNGSKEQGLIEIF